ncbi:2135_t:CDS:2 [Entrophospora sp. SA101]|nr:2135_t:CDS:2 [Entrophospora sp. SA101]
MCRGGRPSSDVWQYFEKNTSKSKGHYTAKCRYCLKFWRRGIPDKLEAHLALKCEKVDREISQIYLKKLATKNSVSDVESEDKMSISTATNSRNSSSSKKKRKTNNNLHSYYENTNCNIEQKQKLDQALLRAFVVCGIPWNVVSNPFFMDFMKLAKPGYDPATRKELSGYAMKQGNFRRICDIAVSYVSRLGFTDIAVSQLIMQMRSFKDDIEKTMFYVPKKNNDIDFSSVANSETVIDGLDLEEEESFTSLELEEDLSDVSDNNIDNNNLSIESIIDLSVLISGSDISAQDITSDITSPFAEGITDYNPHELVANLVTEDE